MVHIRFYQELILFFLNIKIQIKKYKHNKVLSCNTIKLKLKLI